MSEDQRKHKRVVVSFSAIVRKPEEKIELHATVLDISEGGAFIRVNEKQFHVGDHIWIRIFLDPSETLQVNALSEIIYQSLEDNYDEDVIATVEGMESWVRRGGVKGIGIKFLNLEESERKFLRSVLLALE